MQCQCLTQKGKGTQCTRNAQDNSLYCYQHQECPFPVQQNLPKPTLLKPKTQDTSITAEPQSKKTKSVQMLASASASASASQAPTVICLKKKGKEPSKMHSWGVSLENAPSDVMYIGRRMTMGGWNLADSKWKNPFSIKQFGTRDAVIKAYRDYLVKERPDLSSKESLSELSGKTLACWCDPLPCHGHVLRELFIENWQQSDESAQKY